MTEIVEIPNRGHPLTVDHGWREVAQTALDFVERSRPRATDLDAPSAPRQQTPQNQRHEALKVTPRTSQASNPGQRIPNAVTELRRCVSSTPGPAPAQKGLIMKIVVIGGSGLIGSKLVTKLREHGHEAVAASPNTGVNTLTGEGLADTLANAAVVVDVSNSPSFEDAAVLEFFETSTRNLLTAEAEAEVGHHVALSVVGTERLQQSGYFRAKSAQEKLIENSAIPYSIVRATQFFEFVPSMADAAADGGTVRFAPVLFQPIASDEVARAVARISVGSPLNGIVEVAGPEQFRMDEFFRDVLAMRGDPRVVVTDPHASYWGAELGERTLLPGADAVLGETRYGNWPGRTASGK